VHSNATITVNTGSPRIQSVRALAHNNDYFSINMSEAFYSQLKGEIFYAVIWPISKCSKPTR
jgi:hypothetical protein